MRRPHQLATGFACALLLLWEASSARANTIVDLTVAEMATQASAVVHGTVRRVDAVWNDSHTRIFTEIDLEVTSYIAGEGPQLVTIRQVGGRIGDRELLVVGQPSFQVDQQVVVFLEPDGSGEQNRWVVLCMAGGQYSVSTDATTGELVLSQQLLGLTRIPGPGRRSLLRQRVARPLLLRELTSLVRAARDEGGRR